MSGPPAPDTAEALKFLDDYARGKRVILTAIAPDGDGPDKIVTRTFEPGDRAGRREFIDRHQGKRNIYFSVNPTRGPMDKKPAKGNVSALAWLHVDIDPAKGKPLEAERTRIWAKLRALPEELTPSVIIDSGGGYQAFWKLREAVPIDANAAGLEAYNKALAALLGGDNCWNIDRIMRLPGTVNVPDARKRAAGRVRALAKLITFDDRAYDLKAFEHLLPNSDGAGAPDGIVKPIEIDPLPVSDRIKDLIRGIGDPAHPYKSRSEAVFAVLTAMAGAGCGDAPMAAVMLDERLPIGEHVRAQRKPREYLDRQIRRAREHATDPEIAEVNEHHALVLAGDRAAILKEDGSNFHLLPVSAFRLWFANRHKRVGKKTRPLADYWLAHPKRRQYESLVFAPGRDDPRHYNLWRGFAVAPRPGNCLRFLDHLRDNVCRADEALFAWTIAWFAAIFQRPADKFDTSLVLRGKGGTGKTKVGTVIGSLLGEHYVPIASPRYILGQFNSHLRSCLLLFADEAFWAGDHAAEGKIKDLISGDEHLVEFKGKEPFRVANLVRLLVAGNPHWLVPAALEERRFAVLDVGDAHMQDHAYFKAIDEEMASGGREALLFHLLNRVDLNGINLREIPQTAALQDQKIASLTPEQGWWLDLLHSGKLPGDETGTGTAPAQLLFDHYVRHAQQRGARRRAIETAVGMFLSKMCRGLTKREGTYKSYGKSVVGSIYYFPPLAECRAQFAELTRAQLDWKDDPTDWLVDYDAEASNVDC